MQDLFTVRNVCICQNVDPTSRHKTDRPAAPTCRSQTEIVDCGGRRCKSLSARDAFQTRPRLLSVCCLQLPPLFYPCSNMTFKMPNLSHRNRCQPKDAKRLSNITLTNITCVLFLLPREPRTVGPQAQQLFQGRQYGPYYEAPYPGQLGPGQ